MSGLTFETEFDWDDFCRYLTYENRHVLTEKWLRFVSVILATAVERQEVIDIGKTFFRARIGKENHLVVNGYDEQGCFNGCKLQPFSEEEIGAPPPGMAGAGRLNPEGISYLYLSSCPGTALLEVRSWIAQTVMLGKFEILNKLKCINVSSDERDCNFYSGEPPQEICEQRVWAAINNSFSKPLALGNKKFQYIPTQYLAEILKEQGGYDGIIYKSSLRSHGYNIALFDQEKARLIDSKIVEITTLDLSYREVSEPYG